MSRSECLTLLRRVPIGRIGLSVDALPVILSVNFALLGDAIVVRTVPGAKLDAATRGAVVAFQADCYEPDGSTGWSVLIVGRSSEITDPVEIERASSTILPAWAVDDRADHFIRIETTQVSGRRFFHVDEESVVSPRMHRTA